MQKAAKRTTNQCRTQQELPQTNAKRDQDPPTSIARESTGEEANYEEAARGGPPAALNRSPAARGGRPVRRPCSRAAPGDREVERLGASGALHLARARSSSRRRTASLVLSGLEGTFSSFCNLFFREDGRGASRYTLIEDPHLRILN